MNLAEIQKAASDAYRTAHDSHSPSSNPNQTMHERGIAAAVAAVAQAVLAEPTPEEKNQAEYHDWKQAEKVNETHRGWENYHFCTVKMLERRRASMLKPADERVPVLSRWISEADMPEALAALDALPKERA